MRERILQVARDLAAPPPPGSSPLDVDVIAACAGISRRQLHTYYTSVYAITADLDRPRHHDRVQPSCKGRL